MDHGEEVTPSRWMWVPTYALCAAALLMAGAGAALPYFQQHTFIRQLDAEIPRLQPRVRQVERLESEVDGLQKKAAVLEALQAHNARTLEALRELSEILPDTAWITDMNLRGDGMEISGSADSATALIPLLEQSSVFQDVALASGIARNQQGKELFRIRARFKY
jgi:Tfp pilus assembly protein PilN